MTDTVLVTGGAGFIGSHVVDALLARGSRVVCIDNFNDYYDPTLKRARAARHLVNKNYRLMEADIRDRQLMSNLLRRVKPRTLIHLAACAGVRPSIEDPFRYHDVNVTGTLNLLHAAQAVGLEMFVNASSSSVYGENTKLPFEEADALLTPASPYGATKLGAEALTRVYARLFGFRAVSLRFFTVYGPRQRPDMAIARFAERMLQRRPVLLYGDGTARRDFTFVLDIVRGILAAAEYRGSDYEVFNLASGRTVTLLDLVEKLESVFGAPAPRIHTAAQDGDVPATWGSIEKARRLLAYEPQYDLKVGLIRYVQSLLGQPAPEPAHLSTLPRDTLSSSWEPSTTV
jgi:UDP-glucuronate 4-epimerase